MANKYVTTTGAGTKSGEQWANAWSPTELIADITTGADTYQHIYVEAGTYTLTGDVIANRTTSYKFIGVTANTTNEPPTYDDWGYSDDRPSWITGSYQIKLSSYRYWMFNMIISGSYNGIILEGTYVTFYNLSVTNTYNSATAGAILVADYSHGEFLEGICTYGIGVEVDYYSYFNNIVAYDSNIGINLGGRGGSQLSNCIVWDCTIGMQLGYAGQHIQYSTIYNCGTGIDFANKYESTINNCNIVNCNIGIENESDVGSFFYGNNYYNNTTRRENPTRGFEPSYSELDPQFKDPSNANFEPQNLDLIDEAFPETMIGTNTKNTNNAGATQVLTKSNSSVFI